jgi:hypothetical protein
VWLAPRPQLSELEGIGKRFAGAGPTLMTEYQPYGVRHFLRRMDPEGASELRRRQVPLRDGQPVAKGGFADIDEFRLDGLLVYRTLVLARSPVESLPPSVYRLVWSGRYYEVWQRAEPSATRILAHLPLGTSLQVAATPRCSAVVRLARLARGGRLATVLRPSPSPLDLTSSTYPSTWQPADDGTILPVGSGTLDGNVSVPRTARYGTWLGGSFRGRVELLVDGRLVGAARARLEHPGQYTPLGETELRAGMHRVQLRYTAGGIHPGSGGPPFLLGPVFFSRAAPEPPVTYVQPADARSLCGKSLDWVEALGA